MPTFQYTAISTDGSTVRGSTDAPTVEAARAALADLHLDVRELHEASRTEPAGNDEPKHAPPLLSTFAFEGKEASGNIRRGTIQAESKYQAFEKLHRTQHLMLTMLSPVGVTPQYRDYELQTWQKGSLSPQSNVTNTTPPPAPAPPKKVQFSLAPDTTNATAPVTTEQVNDRISMLPGIVATLRLYAGWLLAWYGLFVAAGHYAHERMLPWTIPFAENFYLSSLIYTFTVAIFFFLLLGSLHKKLHGGVLLGAGLSVAWLVSIVVVRIATVPFA